MPSRNRGGNGGNVADDNKDKKLSELSAQMPTLTKNNFYSWTQALQHVEYYAEWDPDIIDILQKIADDWDKTEEHDET